LIPFDASKPDESNDLTKNNKIQSFCKSCFRETSTLDFTKKTYEEINSEPATTGKGITLVMVHGGGASRAMFAPHARRLAERGFRCILVDLPGHGTLEDVPLTLDSCVETVGQVYQECKLVQKSTIYIGVSLGAYAGFYILDRLKEAFCGAVLLDCGQNVGPDCSLKARIGMWALKMAAGNLSNKSLMNSMVSISRKSPAQYKLVESTFGAGMFFQQAGTAFPECMHSVSPAEHISQFEFPILFANGSEDHRDSETRWLEKCRDKRSSLKVYEGGDHFFTHDARFFEDLLDRVDKFSNEVAAM
jgi:pimeloyl-ACP methyl ester carboxylesterase